MARPLTRPMITALQDEIRGVPMCAGKVTVEALKRRKLVGTDGTLTPAGWRQAVAHLPLEEQCHQLGLEHRRIPNPEPRYPPEVAAWRHFQREGFIGSYCEGGAILVLIRASALDVLMTLNKLDSREDACTRFTEAQLAILADYGGEILRAVHSSNTEQMRRNFEEIYAHDRVREWYPSLTGDGMAALHAALGSAALVDITSAIMEDPYAFRKGWPDLTMVKGGAIMWAEVKTTDTLLLSQIVTVQRMRRLLPGFVGVIHLT